MLSDKLLCSDKTARLGLPARGRSLAHGLSVGAVISQEKEIKGV